MNMLRVLSPESALEAARRLKKKLTVRSVIYTEEQQKSSGKRAVICDGEIYDSIRRAATANRVSSFTMTKWIEAGKAAYVED